MKYINVPIPITCPEPRVREARSLLFKANVHSKVINNWPNQQLVVMLKESEKVEDASYIFALGMLVGQFIH